MRIGYNIALYTTMQEKAATLRRKREEQAQWEKDHTIVEDQ